MRGIALLSGPFVMMLGGLARAESPAAASDIDLSEGVATTRAPEGGQYVHGFGELMLGKGLRLNNPFRLATPVGDDPDGLSFTAYYLDLGYRFLGGPASSTAQRWTL
jgi:hypothetical protein